MKDFNLILLPAWIVLIAYVFFNIGPTCALVLFLVAITTCDSL